MENPYFLAEQVGGWLHNGRVAPARERDYADAPALGSISRGENLFRTRGSVCHGIGAEGGLVRQGPDLLGVSARTRQRRGTRTSRLAAASAPCSSSART